MSESGGTVKISAGTRGNSSKTHGPKSELTPEISVSDHTIKLVIEESGMAHGGEAAGLFDIANTDSYRVTRFGGVEMSSDFTLGLFERALDDGMKLSKLETQRLLAKIIQSSAVFDD